MQNEICAIRTVVKPRVIRQAINSSIKAIPVTISALSIGILVTTIEEVRMNVRIRVIPMAANVPITVEITAAISAMIMVL